MDKYFTKEFIPVYALIAGVLLIYFGIYFIISNRKKSTVAKKHHGQKQEETDSPLINADDLELQHLVDLASQEEPEVEMDEILVEKIENIDHKLDLLELNKLARILNNQPLTEKDVLNKINNGERFK